MIELRWLVKKKKRELHGGTAEMVSSEPVLQYKDDGTMVFDEAGTLIHEEYGIDWIDVPTEYIEE